MVVELYLNKSVRASTTEENEIFMNPVLNYDTHTKKQATPKLNWISSKQKFLVFKRCHYKSEKTVQKMEEGICKNMSDNRFVSRICKE